MIRPDGRVRGPAQWPVAVLSLLLLFAGCGDLTIDGTIDGNVYIGAGKITINNEINGDVKVYGGRIIITKKGKINGNLHYATKEKLTESELARALSSSQPWQRYWAATACSVFGEEAKSLADEVRPLLEGIRPRW